MSQSIPHESDPQVADRLSCYATAAGVATVVLSASALVGWQTEVDVLKSILPGIKAMNPATATGFMLTGFSLWLLRGKRPPLPVVWLARLCAGLVVGIALLKLFGLFVCDLHVDNWLFRQKLGMATPANRMSLNSAVNFLLAGSALALLDVRGRRGLYPSQILGAVATGIGMLALLGYAYGARELSGEFAGHIVMALNSSLTWILVGTGILCVRPERGMMAIVSSRGVGGRTVRRLLPAAVLLPLLLGWLKLLGRRAGLFDPEFGMALVAVATIAVFSALVWWSGNSLHAADVSRRRAEVTEAIRLEEARKETLLRLNEMAEASLREITDFALEEAVRLTRSEIGYLAFLNEDESVLTMHSWSKTAMQRCAIIDKPIVYPVVNTGLWGEAVRQRKPVITDDYAAPNPLKKGYPEGHVGVRRHMNLPIFEGRKIVVVAGVGNKEESYDESDVRQLTLLMQGMWQMLQRKQTAAHLAREHAIVDGLNAIFQKGLTSGAVEEVAQTCLAAAQQITQSRCGLIGEMPKGWSDSRAAGDTGWDICRIPECGSRELHRQIEICEIWDRIGKAGQSVILNEPAPGPAQADAPEDRLPMVCLLGIPLKCGPETVGILALANKDAGYTADDMAAVESLAAAFMEVLLRARAEQSLRGHAARLETANRELDAFAYSVSHDLRTPLRSVDGFSQALLEDYRDQLDEQGRDYLERIRAASQRMGVLIDDLLKLSRITSQELNRQPVDLSQLARTIGRDLQNTHPPRDVEFVVQDGLTASGDEHLLRAALQQLLENAWKFTSKQAQACIEVGCVASDGSATYFVRDNGAGFDMTYANKLFAAFQRLHTSSEFPGTGIGLATVQRIIHRHGGRIWAESSPGKGTTFYFTL